MSRPNNAYAVAQSKLANLQHSLELPNTDNPVTIRKFLVLINIVQTFVRDTGHRESTLRNKIRLLEERINQYNPIGTDGLRK